VLKAFSSSGEHLTIDEIYDRARKIDSKIGYTTVWRTLKLLDSCGLAASRKFHDGLIRYECTDESDHHDHLICTSCGAVEEFVNPQIEEIQKRVAKTHNFSMTAHRMELYGLCSSCSKGKKTGKRKKNR
jgi:Fur family ferric uptake transcriptional regulator